MDRESARTSQKQAEGAKFRGWGGGAAFCIGHGINRRETTKRRVAKMRLARGFFFFFFLFYYDVNATRTRLHSHRLDAFQTWRCNAHTRAPRRSIPYQHSTLLNVSSRTPSRLPRNRQEIYSKCDLASTRNVSSR